MKIFVKKYFITSSYLNYYSKQLITHLEYQNKYTLVNSVVQADLVILQIGEVQDLVNLPQKICLLYFHFKPNREEGDYLRILLDTRDDITIISPYEYIIDGFPTLQAPWGNNIKLANHGDDHEGDLPFTIYYHENNQISWYQEKIPYLVDLNEKVIFKKYQTLDDIATTPQSIIIINDIWENVFPHDISQTLNLGSIPLVTTMTELGLYQEVTLTPDNNLLHRLENIREKLLEEFTWDKHLEIISTKINSLPNDKGHYIYVPFLDLPRSDSEITINITNGEIRDSTSEITRKCQGKYNSFSSSGELKIFYPWGLSHCYTTPNQGIYVKTSVYNGFNLPESYLHGYTTFPFMSFSNFNKSVGDDNLLSEDISTIAITSDGSLKKAMIPFHRWNFDSSQNIYLKNPVCRDSFSLVTYLENNDYLPFLEVNLKNLEQLNCRLPIHVFYRKEIVNINEITSSYTLNVNYHNLEELTSSVMLPNEERFQQIKLDILYCLVSCQSETIMYFHTNVYFYLNPELIRQQTILQDSALFFTSTRSYQYIHNPNYKKWCLLNITTDYKQENICLSDTLFLYQRKSHWYSLLITLGLIDDPFSKILTVPDLLKLGLLANNNHYKIKDHDTITRSIGTVRDELLIGWAERKWEQLHFTRIPLWIRVTLPTHIQDNFNKVTWYFEPLMWSIISPNNTCQKIPKSSPLLETLEAIRKICDNSS